MGRAMAIGREPILKILLLSVFALCGQIAASQQIGSVHSAATPVRFSISAQPMESALREFANQARLQLIFATDDIAPGTVAPAVSGLYLPEAALTKLLERTSLSYKFVNANTVSIEVLRSKRR